MMAALVCFSATSCMNDWDDESPVNLPPYGNNALAPTHVVSIKTLKEHFKNVISADTFQLIEDERQIIARVTGNDLGGNIYKQLILQDATGAVVISLNQGGVHGFLAEGTQVLIDLKGLWIGGYGKMPTLGQPYTSATNGKTSIGRMQKDIFDKHFKILSYPLENAVTPIEFDTKMDMEENCGKLVTIKGVTFTAANGTATMADENDVIGGATNRHVSINGKSGSPAVYIRTSTYADFAAMVMPYDKMNKRAIPCTITGIANRYRDDWQILIRKSSDIVIEK